MRIGSGFDVHKLDVEGSATGIILGGIEVPFSRALIAHSDGDVVIHALCDALLGALALGDIGQHFPDSDETWKNVDSAKLLASVMQLILEAGYCLGNADLTVIAENPRLLPYQQLIRERLAGLMDTSTGQVSVKATTTEKLGFAGRGEGIACQAVVLLVSV